MQEINMMGKKKPVGAKTKILMHLNGNTIDEAGNPIKTAVGVSYMDNQKFGRKGASFTRGGYIEIAKNAATTFLGDMTYEFLVTFPTNLATGVEQMVLSNKAGIFVDFLSGVTGWNAGKPCVLLSFSETNDRSKLLVLDTPWIDGKAHHVAASKLNGVWTVFLDGVPSGTMASTTAWDGVSTLIGNYIQIAAYGLSQNTMQEVRFSNFARYTTAFTPPSAPHILD